MNFDLAKEKSQLNNFHTFMRKFLKLMTDEGDRHGQDISEHTLSLSGELVTAGTEELIARYPNGLSGITEDIVFYGQVFHHVQHFVIYENLIAIKQKRKVSIHKASAEDILAELKKMGL